MKEQDKLDDLFKDGLNKPGTNTDYQEQDWNALERMLDKRKKPVGMVYWLPILSSVAALMLLFLGWWFFKPQVADHSSKRQQQVNHRQQNNGTGQKYIAPNGDTKQHVQENSNYANNQVKAGKGHKARPIFTSPSGIINEPNAGKTVITGRQETEMLTAVNPIVIDNSLTMKQQSMDFLPGFKGSVRSSSKQKNSGIKQKLSSRTQFALSVIASPDLNGVNSFQQSKLGGNVGLLFSVGLSKKLTITTGAIYSVKPYTTGFQNYHSVYQFQTDPVNVTADCRVLDIPVNIGYQLYNKQRNKFSVGTGLSSYIMLRENYKFNYANPYASGPADYNVVNQNQHILGVLNINATYERQINSKVGVSIQPYMKIPLTNIGYSQVRLQTAGVAVGLNWKLNSSRKP